MGKKTSTDIYLPTKVGNTIGNTADGVPKVGCYEIFLGDPTGVGIFSGKMNGVFKTYGKMTGVEERGTRQENIDFLNHIGYTELGGNTATNKGKYCVEISKGTGLSGDTMELIGTVCWKQTDLEKGIDYSGEFGALAETSTSTIWAGSLGNIGVDDGTWNCTFSQTLPTNSNNQFDVSSITWVQEQDDFGCRVADGSYGYLGKYKYIDDT